ncbi:autotransporter assembly complex protein TamA [Vibrio splendidus]|nr:autotransporter assembly complex family protein [Vibrio splendidus]MDH5910766.1 autotransporter assembly complex protein TamA [Vibrio splendidus]MDH5940610.1 autotransporter assembly complex protein TamA [Vibrio splendidus]MDH5983624.1 autotransporter assembly complex protein TamA [Vibrio splendidus]MDH5992635.1 autotransporter assembly complex protein TamA [Vibrio splendidus]MDH6003791.1 autotransporter assembly complex protein TamA [Vibrio splendidus]
MLITYSGFEQLGKRVKTSIKQTILTASLFIFTQHSSIAAEFKVKGLNKTLTENVELYLEALADVPASQLSKKKIAKRIENALNPYGYYHPQLDIELNDPDNITLNIDSGPVMRIAGSDVKVSGKASKDDEFIKILNQSKLDSGLPLSHLEYDKTKQAIFSLAKRKGYFDGKFIESKIEVIPSDNIANIYLHFCSGPRYKFGSVSVPQNGVEPIRIEKIPTFKQGDDFDTIKLGQLQSDLSDTLWFRSVVVHNEFNHLDNSLEVPIEIIAEPSSRDIVQVGGGYSTDLGFRASLNWLKPWYNRRGHSFETQTYLSEQEQSLQLGYKIPTEKVTTDYFGIQFESKRIDHRDTKSFSNDLKFERYWQLDSDWQSTIYVKYLHEQYRQASEEEQSQLFLPGISFSQVDRKNDQLELNHRHIYSIEYSDPSLFSDSRLLRLEGNSVVSWDISDEQKLHFRSNVGINIAKSLSDVPSSLRYFAGGDGNLRGYGYESISPRDENGELTGARYMLTAGIEYQHQVYRSIWLGAFLDVGDAFDQQADWKRGTGVSLIWNSQLMPVKLDFAYGLDAPEGDEFRIHFSLGTQF